VNEMARALDRVERNRQASMRHAREIQQRLLPQGTYMGREVQVVSVFEPADSVGGDFHDVIELPDGSLILAILDVSGHGVPAALYTALLRTVLRHQIAAGADLNAVLRTMNEEFNAVAGGSGDFATCCLLKLDPRAGALSYLNAGHEPPIIVGSTGVTLLDQEHGPPVGVGDLAPASVCQASLEPGERLFLYSDGLHEVFDDHNKQFGRERLTQALVDTSRQPPDAQLKAVLERVRSFARQGRLTDDVTLLCAQRRTGADRHGP
jgi:sigma-B regulation protein RsbU (phosphoserine phosphatase)